MIIGIRKKEIVTICCDISKESVALVFALFKMGAIPSLINNSLLSKRIIDNMNSTGSAVVFIETNHESKLNHLKNKLDYKACIIELGSIEDTGKRPYQYSTSTVKNEQFHHKELTFIISTTGSTSGPKPVAISLKNVRSVIDQVPESLGLTTEDRVLTYSGLSTDYGFYNTMLPLVLGGTVLSKSYPSAGIDVINDIIDSNATALQVFPPVIALMVAEKSLCKLNDSNLKYISSSGQKLYASSIEMLLSCIPGVTVFSNYGMTECKRISSNKINLSSNLESVGKPLADTKVKLIDSTGDEIHARNLPGELYVSSDMVMLGYVHNMKLDDGNVCAKNCSSERWLKTGDIFQYDDFYNLVFKSRADDVFHRHLYSVYPIEIEKFLASLLYIVDAKVIAKDDAVAGKVPIAYVVSEKPSIENYIMNECRANLDWQSVPAEVILVRELKVNSAGKTIITNVNEES